MSYVFSDQQSKLSSLLGDSNTGTEDQFPLATRKKELNRGELKFMCDALCVLEYTTGTISGTTLNLPSDWVATWALVINNRIVDDKRKVSLKDYERYYQFAGSPPYWYYEQVSGVKRLGFYGSTNGQTYKLWYFKKITTELSADADESKLEEQFREGPCFYAAAQLLKQIGKNSIADGYMAEYRNLVRDAQKWVEENLPDISYPNVDVNMIGASEVDISGGGLP